MELFFLVVTAAAAPTGFCLCALIRMGASHTGDAAFLCPDEIEHDGGSDNE